MNEQRHIRPDLGNDPPLIADRRRKPDRRQVSARWLAGTLLTGLTSTALMGIALSAAHDGRASMASPAVRAVATAHVAAEEPEKGERVFATAIPIERSRRTIEVSTLVEEGEREVIRTQPFAYVSMLLGARHSTPSDYPAFDAFEVFASQEEEEAAATPANLADTGQIYDAKVEPDVALVMEPFDFDTAVLDDFEDIGTKEAELLVRGAAGHLDTLPVQVAAFQPFDPGRFDIASDVESYVPGSAIRIIQENVSVATSDVGEAAAPRYFEEIIPFRQARSIADALAESGYPADQVAAAAKPLEAFLGKAEMEAGEVLRIGLQERASSRRIVRLSAYRAERHLATVAVTDEGAFAEGPEPALSRSVAQAFDESATEAPMRSSMPTVYDGIYQAALSYGLDDRLCQRLIRMLASEVDYQARLEPTDRLTILYSLEDGRDQASAESEILFVEAKFGDSVKRYYRFWTEDDDSVDYYDADGRSAKQFLLRNPVPNGRFTSEFGSRRHPVLGYTRTHWGVDWAAPRGTPILASGSGTVVKAGWASGYGRQTVIKHANGYQTSYSHQSAIAKGVSAGATIRQGQVIGYVGSTGLSTGNHLHYEVSVNGKRVDPMRIRLPSGRVLEGEQLDLFKRERERIDNLLKESDEDLRLAER